jgi:hypothetical protein
MTRQTTSKNAPVPPSGTPRNYALLSSFSLSPCPQTSSATFPCVHQKIKILPSKTHRKPSFTLAPNHLNPSEPPSTYPPNPRRPGVDHPSIDASDASTDATFDALCLRQTKGVLHATPFPGFSRCTPQNPAPFPQFQISRSKTFGHFHNVPAVTLRYTLLHQNFSRFQNTATASNQPHDRLRPSTKPALPPFPAPAVHTRSPSPAPAQPNAASGKPPASWRIPRSPSDRISRRAAPRLR